MYLVRETYDFSWIQEQLYQWSTKKSCGEFYHQLIQGERVSAATGVNGVNGLPLNVVGKVKIPVKLGEFEQEQTFIVVGDLSVDCLLGADFFYT